MRIHLLMECLDKYARYEFLGLRKPLTVSHRSFSLIELAPRSINYKIAEISDPEFSAKFIKIAHIP